MTGFINSSSAGSSREFTVASVVTGTESLSTITAVAVESTLLVSTVSAFLQDARHTAATAPIKKIDFFLKIKLSD